jgi:hypothetical protein
VYLLAIILFPLDNQLTQLLVVHLKQEVCLFHQRVILDLEQAQPLLALLNLIRKLLEQ